ncbi:hypothetical protein DL96DRAFT_856794 [Flagelloscypha sp. PMI_526]|nr:hypothetical protein DL96DRAFT_856794 [Flagelloscypha sp. PMI_526]
MLPLVLTLVLLLTISSSQHLLSSDLLFAFHLHWPGSSSEIEYGFIFNIHSIFREGSASELSEYIWTSFDEPRNLGCALVQFKSGWPKQILSAPKYVVIIMDSSSPIFE